MFKKPFVTNQAHNVSGADRKKLKRALAAGLNVSGPALDALLPAKGDFEKAKLGSGCRGFLYFFDGRPIILDTSGRGDYVPTCYGLWRCPTLLPRLLVKHPAVSQYLLSGADLMLPGIRLDASTPDFAEDTVVAICVPGNPAPVAVGTATMSRQQAFEKVAGGNGKGKIVNVIQVYGDHLWADVGGAGIPNRGFLKDGVVPEIFDTVKETLQPGTSKIIEVVEAAVRRHLIKLWKTSGDEAPAEGAEDVESTEGDPSALAPARLPDELLEELNGLLLQLPVGGDADSASSDDDSADEGRDDDDAWGPEGNLSGVATGVQKMKIMQMRKGDAERDGLENGNAAEEEGDLTETDGSWELVDPEPARGSPPAAPSPLRAGADVRTCPSGQVDGPTAAPAVSSAPVESGIPASAPAPWWPEDMDELLEMVLLQAFKKSVKDDELPLTSSVLWAQHVLPVRPAGSCLDVKRSRHRKLAKFLDNYASQKLFKGKVDKKSGDYVITYVNRKCDLYVDFVPYKSSEQQNVADAASPAAAPAGAAAQAQGAAPALLLGTSSVGAAAGAPAPLKIEELLKPARDMFPLFEAMGARTDALYTAQEAYDIAVSYVKEKKLDENDPRRQNILLDGVLSDALFKGAAKATRGETVPLGLAKAFFREALIKRMLPQFRISRGELQSIKRGVPPTVVITSQKRQGNKKITRIVGVETFFVDPQQLAVELKRRFASSTSVGDLPCGQNQTHHLCEIMLQGTFVQKVADFLTEVYGVPKAYISAEI